MNTSGSSVTTGSSKVCSTRRSGGGSTPPAGRSSSPPAMRWACRPGGPKRARTSPAGSAGEVAEAGQAHAGEQADELGVGLADVLQPGDRERGEERRRAARRDDDRVAPGPPGGDGGGEAAVGDADPDVGGRLGANGGDDLLGQPFVTAEVARRAAGAEAQPPRLDDLEARGEPADGAHDGLERPGVAVGVVVEQHDVGAALLGLAPALADRPRRRRRRPANGRRRGWRAARRPAPRRPRRRRRPASPGTTRRPSARGHHGHPTGRSTARPARRPRPRCRRGRGATARRGAGGGRAARSTTR